MLTVYFVDDDSLIIEELKSIINWNEYGFEIIGYNTDSIKALDEINLLKPDLIFSDVQMDEMSGLKMVSKIEQETNVVFISAYDIFEYAVDAIRLKALNYLKKPIKKIELINIVCEVKKKKIEQFNQNVFMITSQKKISNLMKEELTAYFDSCKLLPKMDYRLLSVYGKEISNDIVEHIVKNSKYVHILYQDSNLFISINYYLLIDKIKELVDLDGVNIAISGLFSDFKQIYDNIRHIRANSKIDFFKHENKIILLEEIENKTPKIITDLSECDNVFDFKTNVLKLYNSLREGVLCYDIQKIYSTIVSGLFKFSLVDNTSDLLDVSVLDFYNDYIEMLDDLCCYFNDNKECIDLAENVIYNIVEEMKKDLKSKISLSTFSKKYNYNTSYLSIMFKKVMGVSFINYLTELKMNYAKSLIINYPKLPLKTIANEVGYYDYYHFSKMFKKVTDYSPTDFRETKKW